MTRYHHALGACIISTVLLLVQPWGPVVAMSIATKALPPMSEHQRHQWLLLQVLDTEITAAKTQKELYHQKAQLLRNLLSNLTRIQQSQKPENVSSSANDDSISRQRRRSKIQAFDRLLYYKDTYIQHFNDWFKPHTSFYPSETLQCDDHPLHLQMISLRENTGGGAGRKKNHGYPSNNWNQHQNSQSTNNTRDKKNRRDTWTTASAFPLLQFLLKLNPSDGIMTFVHPMTKEIVWQYALQSSNITDFAFVSDRSIQRLATLTAGNELTLYKLRVWHNKRLISGEYRRPNAARDRPQCLVTHQMSSSRTPNNVPYYSLEDDQRNPWMLSTGWTSAAPAYGLHIELELIFRSSLSASGLNSAESYDKLAVVSFYKESVVVVSSTHGGRLSFFHANNGTFIATLDQEFGKITYMEPLHTGLLAVSAANGVNFIDALQQRILPVICEISSKYFITSIEKDPSRSSVLYAGTSDGHGLVFRLHHVNKQSFSQESQSRDYPHSEGDLMEKRSEMACVLEQQLVPRLGHLTHLNERVSTIAASSHFRKYAAVATTVAAIPGYLLLATPANLAVYRIESDSRLATYITEKPIATHLHTSDRHGQRAMQYLVQINVAKDFNAHPAVLALHFIEDFGVNDGNVSQYRHRLDVFESRLPAPTTSLDLGWMRAPVMLLCALVVMFWHQRRQGMDGMSGSSNQFPDLEHVTKMMTTGTPLIPRPDRSKFGVSANQNRSFRI